MATNTKVDVLMVGTGEYTTGYVGGKAADSDKGAGVVALTMFDLRRRNKVNRLGMCGVNVSINVRCMFDENIFIDDFIAPSFHCSFLDERHHDQYISI